MEPRILLISPPQLSWSGLRAALEELPDIQAVGHARRLPDALTLARDLLPNVILMAPKVEGTSALLVVRELRACCPDGRILLLGEPLGAADLIELAEAGIAGYLLWDALSPDAIMQILSTVLLADLLVASHAAAAPVIQAACARRPTRQSAVHLSAQKQAVLNGLANGRTQTQIALAEHMSERGVRRTVNSLEAQLEAPSTFVLGARAMQMGLIPEALTPDETWTLFARV